MADIKLTYFNARGRAEISRLILAYANVKYEDERLNGEQFGAIKTDPIKAPYGQMPLLCFDGTVICQSMTIARFLANEYGLGGKDSLAKALANEAADTLNDIFEAGMPAFLAKGDQQAELKVKYLEKAGGMLRKLEARMVALGGQYLAGNQLTWADLLLTNVVEHLTGFCGLKIAEYPKLNNLNYRVLDLPNIKHWIAHRPVTAM